jgi:hypothetical protein
MRDARLHEVRMLYLARLHNGTGTRVQAHDEARLEAGWVQQHV